MTAAQDSEPQPSLTFHDKTRPRKSSRWHEKPLSPCDVVSCKSMLTCHIHGHLKSHGLALLQQGHGQPGRREFAALALAVISGMTLTEGSLSGLRLLPVQKLQLPPFCMCSEFHDERWE